MADTRYCDNSGLSALLVANRLCKGVNGTLVVAPCKSRLEVGADRSQLESVLSITPTANEAMDALFMGRDRKERQKDQ
ncbi:MAG: hypothetical protein IPP33_11700 [Flavobacteriales bacterium]|nr:hypothetical protein [Flavobacteriales bacterium]